MSEDMEPIALELNESNLRKGLQQYNYFPFTHDKKEEMPPIFNSEGLTKELSGKLLAVGVSKDRKKSGFDDMSYRRTRHPNIPRVLSIPHPLPYLMLVDTIIQNWDDNIRPVCQSPSG